MTTTAKVLKIQCVLAPSPTGRNRTVPEEATLVTIEVQPSTLSYATWHPIAERLHQNIVYPLICPSGSTIPQSSEGSALTALQRKIRSAISMAGNSKTKPLQVAKPTLGALFDAIALNEQELVAALHDVGVKRFFACHGENWLQSDKRVVVVDAKFEMIMEYVDPFGALEVFERLSNAKVVARNDLEILEWSPASWVPLAPESIDPWPMNAGWEGTVD